MSLSFEETFREALDRFPYPNYISTGRTEGELVIHNGQGEYSEEITFDGGTLMGESIVCGGSITIRLRAGGVLPEIIGLFGMVNDFDDGTTNMQDCTVMGEYHLDRQAWELWNIED